MEDEAKSEGATALAISILSALSALCVVTLVAVAAAPLYAAAIPLEVPDWQWAAAFATIAAVGVAAALTKAFLDKSLAEATDKPLEHISGWSFIGLAIAVVAIVALARWAAASADVGDVIRVEMGRMVVLGVAAAFVIAVLATWAPFVRLAGQVASPVSGIINFIGRSLSLVDAALVFAVAGAAGAGQTDARVRFFMLFGVLGTCAAMGYWLDPPWGLLPIAWGFLTAIAMSRCWAWVEDDRELAMLSGKYYGDHLRIGFKTYYRAEALWAFTALFFLVPLALRQAQLLADANGTELFAITGAPHDDIIAWIGFYGTELAKAVPFVDWAEVYKVEGNAPIVADNEAARHVVFTTRVIVDLLLLATLLQALAVAARNGSQAHLFYVKKQIFKLDPFTENTAFRGLRKREGSEWITDPEALKNFPPNYDLVRLVELCDKAKHPDIYMVATDLRQLAKGEPSSEEFAAELARRISVKKKDVAAIEGILTAIKAADSRLPVAKLDAARRELNEKKPMNDARVLLMELIVKADPAAPARFVALAAALRGDDRDSIKEVRWTALDGLKAEILDGVPAALDVVDHVIKHDRASTLRDYASELRSKAAPPRQAA